MRARLAATGATLARHAALWQARPFATLPPPWAADWPRATAWLEALDERAIDAIEAADLLPAEAPAELRALEGELATLAASCIDRASVATGALAADGDGWRIPGRKRAQIAALAAALGPAPAGATRVVDWCAGKAHLGRTLAGRWRLPLTAIELEAGYAAEAEALAARAAVPLTFVAADVLAPDPRLASALGAGATAVALHACGGLGLQLVRLAATHGAAAVALAPCCYHRAHLASERVPAPLSLAARAVQAAHGLTLDHSALRLATADEVVAPGRLRRGRRRENAWRLGLDLLVRAASGEDRYTPLGVLPPELLARPFGAFAQGMADLRGLPLPPAWDAARAEAAGWERARRARGLGLLRSLFRRTLELHLVLDRAAFLAEAGFAVEVATFCARAVSPRNLLVIARRAV